MVKYLHEQKLPEQVENMGTLDIFNDLSDHINLKINSCREEFHDEAWVENKIHSDYDLWFILDGQTTIEISGSSFRAAAGDVVFFYPGMPYSAYMGQKGCRFVYIHFEFCIGNNYKILNDFDFAGIIPGDALGEAGGIFRTAWQGYHKSGVPYIMLKGCLSILLSRIMDVCSKDSEKIYSFPHMSQKNKAGKLTALEPVFTYISENLDRKIKISELSGISCMSEKYFINYFKDTIGIPPMAYINQLKMNRARNYIYQKKYSVKQIANLLGYADQYTFSKAFKKYFSVSPSNFV